MNNLNAALAGAGAIGMVAIEDLPKSVAVGPEAVPAALRNNGGGGPQEEEGAESPGDWRAPPRR